MTKVAHTRRRPVFYDFAARKNIQGNIVGQEKDKQLQKAIPVAISLVGLALLVPFGIYSLLQLGHQNGEPVGWQLWYSYTTHWMGTVLVVVAMWPWLYVAKFLFKWGFDMFERLDAHPAPAVRKVAGAPVLCSLGIILFGFGYLIFIPAYTPILGSALLEMLPLDAELSERFNVNMVFHGSYRYFAPMPVIAGYAAFFWLNRGFVVDYIRRVST